MRQHRPDQPGLLGRGDCEAVRRAERGRLAVEGKVAVVRHKLGSYHVAFSKCPRSDSNQLPTRVPCPLSSRLAASHDELDGAVDPVDPHAETRSYVRGPTDVVVARPQTGQLAVRRWLLPAELSVPARFTVSMPGRTRSMPAINCCGRHVRAVASWLCGSVAQARPSCTTFDGDHDDHGAVRNRQLLVVPMLGCPTQPTGFRWPTPVRSVCPRFHVLPTGSTWQHPAQAVRGESSPYQHISL